MTDLVLYYAPDTCARVTMIALEETGAPYRCEVIAFARGDHRSPAYLANNPAGKVPTLVIDGQPLIENVAILTWLDQRFPEAKLLPLATDPLQRALILADLTHFAANLHPIVSRIRIPQLYCDLPEARERVFALGEATMQRQLASIDARLEQNRWWYGDQWSVVDAYLNWVWFRITGTAFDGAAFPNISRHDRDMHERPAVRRTIERHNAAAATLTDQGFELRFDGPGALKPVA